MWTDKSSPSTSSMTSARDPAAFLDAVDVGDIRMIQRRQRLRFTLESREPLGVVGEGVGQDLERDVALQPGVGRAIDLAHAPGTERGDDLIKADAGAGCEGQWA